MKMITGSLTIGVSTMALMLGVATGDNSNSCVQDQHIRDAIHRLKERIPQAQITVVDCDPRPTDDRR